MTRTLLAFATLLTLAAGPATAEDLNSVLGVDQRIQTLNAEELILKDPMIAGLMSAAVPGLGQIYSGKKGRGLAFFVATVGALGATAAFAEPADLDLMDYDRIEYGGNGDGVMSVAELQNWEDGEFQDDAFADLSTGRKVGAVTSGVVGLSLYVWNIIDARRSSRDYNRKVVQRRIDLGLIQTANQTGLALNFNF